MSLEEMFTEAKKQYILQNPFLNAYYNKEKIKTGLESIKDYIILGLIIYLIFYFKLWEIIK